MKMFSFFTLLLFSMPFLWSASHHAGPERLQDDGPYLLDPKITAKDVYHHISILASDSLEGRNAGSKAEFKAGDYIKNYFENFGLKAFSGTYFQTFPLSSGRKNYGSELSFGNFRGLSGEDFLILNSPESTEALTREVVFVDFGFQYALDKMTYDSVEINNKWLLMFAREADSPEIPKAKRALIFRLKDAIRKGAAGVLIVDPKNESQDPSFQLSFDKDVSKSIIRISTKMSDSLFRYVNMTTTDAVRKLENNTDKCIIRIPVEVTGSIRKDTSRNVIAVLEGKDPVLKKEYIVVGAHYDHLGKQLLFSKESKPYIYYGADDNASGTAGLLEIAQQLSTENNLKRSIIFVAFGAEEQGLLGSHFFVNNLPVPREKIAFMVNLDMIGRMNQQNQVFVNAVDPQDTTNVALKKINVQFPELDLIISSKIQVNTDHFSFYEKGIPVMFFTSGLHPDYHSPRDTAGAINYEGEKRMLDLICELIKTKVNE